MSDFNPYRASQPAGVEAQIPLADGQFPLATLLQRFAGNFIDTALLAVLMLVLYIPIMIAYMTFIDPTYGDAIEARNIGEFLLETGMAMACLSVAFFGLNGYLIANRGQTIGKYLMKTQMVGERGELVSLTRIFLNRYLLFWVLGMLPVIQIINLIDPLAILGEQRKCLHDRVARTKVISLR